MGFMEYLRCSNCSLIKTTWPDSENVDNDSRFLMLDIQITYLLETLSL
ncbi:MAG: hypothetical protein HeimC3_21180 [Candidatus Heimdallarchaeota archaeon LC_3]|nr:MAG: hypothetical protein HeimC3_21180 [Candidatus Heimdallarchaeota archaeon LC_3]